MHCATLHCVEQVIEFKIQVIMLSVIDKIAPWWLLITVYALFGKSSFAVFLSSLEIFVKQWHLGNFIYSVVFVFRRHILCRILILFIFFFYSIICRPRHFCPVCCWCCCSWSNQVCAASVCSTILVFSYVSCFFGGNR